MLVFYNYFGILVSRYTVGLKVLFTARDRFLIYVKRFVISKKLFRKTKKRHRLALSCRALLAAYRSQSDCNVCNSIRVSYT